MNAYLWLFDISLALAAIGFWMYTYEVIQRRITRTTRWSELTGDQWSYVGAMGVGAVGIITTVLVKALS
jgi:hypothetical protein